MSNIHYNGCQLKINYLHRVRKKVPLYFFAANFAKCWPISRLLSPTDL